MNSTYLLLLILVPFIAYFYYRSLKGQANWKKQNSNAQLDEIAKRLKLQIIQGEPSFNLVATGRGNPFAPKEVNAVLTGTPYTHPIEIFYYDKRWVEEGLLGSTRYHEFDGRVTITSEITLPFFEVSSRDPGMGDAIGIRLHLPPSTFDDPMLDERLILGTVDADVAKKLAPLLVALLPIGYVHIVGQGNQITLVMTEMGMISVMGQLDQWVHLLESIACVLEGKPTPGAYQGETHFSSAATTEIAMAPSSSFQPLNETVSSDMPRMSTQIPIPCKTCGAPMKEVETTQLHEPVRVVCEFCHASETLPGDPGERVIALRTRLTQMKWAEDAAKGPGLAMAQITESGYWVGLLVFMTLFMGYMIYQGYEEYVRLLARIAPLDRAQQLSILHDASPISGFSIGALMGSFFGVLAMWLTYKQGVRPKILARPPLQPDHAMRCRQCGGDLPNSVGPFIACSYCHAQNLVTPEIAKNQAALLERETREYKKRAEEGHQEIRGLAKNAMNVYYLGIGAGLALGLMFGYVVKTLILYYVT